MNTGKYKCTIYDYFDMPIDSYNTYSSGNYFFEKYKQPDILIVHQNSRIKKHVLDIIASLYEKIEKQDPQAFLGDCIIDIPHLSSLGQLTSFYFTEPYGFYDSQTSERHMQAIAISKNEKEYFEKFGKEALDDYLFSNKINIFSFLRNDSIPSVEENKNLDERHNKNVINAENIENGVYDNKFVHMGLTINVVSSTPFEYVDTFVCNEFTENKSKHFNKNAIMIVSKDSIVHGSNLMAAVSNFFFEHPEYFKSGSVTPNLGKIHPNSNIVSFYVAQASLGSQEVKNKYLWLIPITSEELHYYMHNGPEALEKSLWESKVNLYSLNRKSSL